MFSITNFGYLIAAIIFFAIVYIFCRTTEHVACLWRHQIPFVPSNEILRDAVVKEILAHYPNMKTVCDLGSGYGGLARKIARKCNMNVTAIENMPFAMCMSKFMDFITRTKSKTVWCDAFEYLENGDGFDIAVAYLGPGINDRLAEYTDKFRVLITLDVPVDGLSPARTIDMGRGATYYGTKKFPHKLFIYEF